MLQMFLMRLFVLLLLLCSNYNLLIYSESVKVATGEECNILGDQSFVVCTTENTFKISLDSPEIFTCPAGLVCANHPEICVNFLEPACVSLICGTCLPGAQNTCVDRKTYAACVDGQISNMVKYCQASRPYCSIDYSSGIPYVNCTSIFERTCTYPVITTPPPTTSPPSEDECTSNGKFAVTSDPTCKRYYYCYASGNGGMAKELFACPGATLFNPQKGKCVLDDNYQCNQE